MRQRQLTYNLAEIQSSVFRVTLLFPREVDDFLCGRVREGEPLRCIDGTSFPSSPHPTKLTT